MFAGGEFGFETYSPWEPKFSSLNDGSAWGTQPQGAVMYQQPLPSCNFCLGEHLFEDCPHKSDSFRYAGSMNCPYSVDCYQGGGQCINWEEQYSAATSFAEQEPQISNFSEQWQPHMQEPQQYFEQPQQENSSSMENLFREFIAKQESIIQSQAASLRSLESQVKHVAIEIRTRIQEEEEQRKIARLIELENEWRATLDEEAAELQFAVAARYAPAHMPACPPVDDAADAFAPAAPDAAKHDCPDNSGSTLAPACSIDLAPAKDCTSENTDLPAPADLEEPASTGTEGDAAPALTMMQLMVRSDTRPEGEDDVLVIADNLVFPSDFMILDFEEDKEVPSIMQYIGIPVENSKNVAVQKPKKLRPEFKRKYDKKGAEPLRRLPKKKRAYSFLSPVD